MAARRFELLNDVVPHALVIADIRRVAQEVEVRGAYNRLKVSQPLDRIETERGEYANRLCRPTIRVLGRRGRQLEVAGPCSPVELSLTA